MPNVILPTAGEEILVHLLKTNADVDAMVRESPEEIRIAPDQAPIAWKGKTGIVYAKISDRRPRPLGSHSLRTGYTVERFAIYCVDRNRGVSRQLAAAIRLAIVVNSPQTIIETKVMQVFVPDGETDQSLPGQDGQDAPERYRTLEAVIHYNQGA